MAERRDNKTRQQQINRIRFDDFGAKFRDTRPPVLTSVTDIVWMGIDGLRPFCPPSVQVGNVSSEQHGYGSHSMDPSSP